MLYIWPALPIYIYAHHTETSPLPGVTNIISALQQHNRVCTVSIDGVPNSLLNELAAMDVPFPALTELALQSNDENAPILPDSFLSGTAPRLQSLLLWGILFPALPRLLLSTHDLVNLDLWDIPRSGYISPEAMVTGLSTLTRLEILVLQFRSPQSQADRASRHPPPLTRVILPALTEFSFKGDSEYLEDILSRVDTPVLDDINITFFNQLVFDTPLLRHFISRTKTFTAPHRVEMTLSTSEVVVDLFRRNGTASGQVLRLYISCKALDWQLSSLAQVCSSSFPPYPTLEHLVIDEIQLFPPQRHDNMEDGQWLELLRPFASVKDLDLSGGLVPFVAPALQEISGERVTEVLPTLQNLFLAGPQPSGPVKEAIGKFIVARQLSECPVTVHHWDDKERKYKRWEVGD